jgi:hypothetical protein
LEAFIIGKIEVSGGNLAGRRADGGAASSGQPVVYRAGGEELSCSRRWEGGAEAVTQRRRLEALAELESTVRGSNRIIYLINMLINHLNIFVTVHSLEK